MIVSIFNHGTSKASSAIDYLLGAKDSNGKIRNPPPTVFEGDVELTSFLIDSNHRKFKYTSGVIAFNKKNNENPTQKELREIVESFRECFCPGLGPDRVNMLFVQHEEGLHFLVPMAEIQTLRQFNLSPPGKHSKQLQRDFSAYWNHKLDYEQVVEDPFKAMFTKFDAKVTEERKEKFDAEGSRTRSRKERLSYEIAKRIKAGRIKNREDLIDFLNSKDFQVTRRGKDYLSVKMPGKEKAVRFRGGCFIENADYKELVQKANTASSKLTPSQFDEVRKRMNITINFRQAFNEKRYSLAKRMPKMDYKPAYTKPNAQKNEPMKLNGGSFETQAKCNGIQRPKNSQAFNSLGGSAVVHSISFEKMLANIGSLESKILALSLKLSHVPASQRNKIEQQIGELRLQLIRLQQQMEEARKAELNKEKPIAKKWKI